MHILRQSTAVDVLIGPFVDKTDGNTLETGKTLDVELSKNGQGLANKNDSTAPTDDTGGNVDGYYNCELDATDTNTVGTLRLCVHHTDALPVWHDFQVVEEAIYDALFAAGATGELLVDVAKISGDATAANNLELMYDGTGYAGGSTKLAVNTTQIEGSDATDQINAACDAAIVTYNLDHLMHTAVASNADMTTEVPDGTVLSNLMTKTGDTSDYAYATDSLEALGEDADAILADTNELQGDWTNGGRLDLIVDGILADTAVIGSAGAGLTAIPWNSSWDAEVQSECTDALNAYDPPTKAELDATWTTAQTESYASDGAAATPAQLLYMIYCAVGEFSISGTTITGKKVDGSTTAMTWTINSESSPTSRTRSG